MDEIHEMREREREIYELIKWQSECTDVFLTSSVGPLLNLIKSSPFTAATLAETRTYEVKAQCH